jgi:outer membrane autotransporter protein
MKTTDLRKFLLAGTALVAVGGFAVGANAADEFAFDANDSGTFTTSGPDETADDTATTGFDNYAVQFRGNSATLNVANGETIGNSAVLSTAIVATTAGNDASGDTLTLINDTDNVVATVTVDGSISKGDTTGFNLVLDVLAEDAGDDEDSITYDINGSIDLGTGTLTINSDDTQNDSQANTNTVLISGNVTTGGIALSVDDANQDDDDAVTVNFDGGTTAQTVTGNITTAATGEGLLLINNSAGVTFEDEIGTNTVELLNIDVGSANGASTVTFTEAVYATNLTLSGNGDGDDITVNLDSTDGDFEVEFAIAVDNAADDHIFNVSGGNTVTLDQDQTVAVDTVNITGSGTTFVVENFDATTINIGSGAILQPDTAGVEITSAIEGVSSGVGTLDVKENLEVIGGSIGATNKLALITIEEGDVFTFDGNGNTVTLDATSIFLEDAASDGTDAGIVIDAGGDTVTVKGPITVGVDGEGSITLNDGDDSGTVAFTADIGTSTKALGLLTSTAAGSNETMTTTGNLYVDTITLDDSDVLQFLGTSAQVVSGTINGVDAANEGVLTIGNGTTASNVTFNGIIGATRALNSLNVSANAAATFAANATIGTGAIDNDGTVTINSGVTLAGGGGYTADAAAGVFNIGVKRTAGTLASGAINITAGGAVDLSNDTVNFVVESGSQPLVAGSTLTDFISGNTGAATNPGTITDNSYLFDFTIAAGSANDLTATVVAANSINNTVASGLAATGNQLMTSLNDGTVTNTEINLLQSTIQSKSSASEVNKTVEAAASDVAAGAVSAGVAVANQTSSITGTRLAALRSGDVSGMAAGDLSEGVKVWGQAFAEMGTQDERDGVSGYDADTYGFVAGIDTETLADGWTVGLALAYADTEVDSDGLGNGKNEIDSYQVSLYGDYDLDDTTYVSGQLGYIWGDNDTTRNPGGVSTLTANGDYDSDTYTASLEVGRDYAYSNDLTITPSVGVNYVHYSADSYTETGAGGANLAVGDADLDIFEIGLGVDASWKVQNADGSYLKPVLSAGVRHDLIGDEYEVSNQFGGGTIGSSFKVEGFDPAQTTFDLGAGVTYFSTDNWEFSADYGYEFKSDYDAHSAALKAAYKF